MKEYLLLLFLPWQIPTYFIKYKLGMLAQFSQYLRHISDFESIPFNFLIF